MTSGIGGGRGSVGFGFWIWEGSCTGGEVVGKGSGEPVGEFADADVSRLSGCVKSNLGGEIRG